MALSYAFVPLSSRRCIVVCLDTAILSAAEQTLTGAHYGRIVWGPGKREAGFAALISLTKAVR